MRLIFEEYLNLNLGAWSFGSMYALDGGLSVVASHEDSLLATYGDLYNCLLLRHLNMEGAVWALTNKHNSAALTALLDVAGS